MRLTWGAHPVVHSVVVNDEIKIERDSILVCWGVLISE